MYNFLRITLTEVEVMKFVKQILIFGGREFVTTQVITFSRISVQYRMQTSTITKCTDKL